MVGTCVFLVAALCFTGAVKSSGLSNRGRLLSPEEGCGIQPVDKLLLMQYYNNWPWMGSLLTPSDTKPLVSKCTAILITSRHALTSANCVSDQPLFVRLGETPKTDDNLFNDYVVAKWIVHPKAKAKELKNNIAILALAQDVEFSDRIRPACLPTKPSMINERASEIYRLVRENTFDATKAAAYGARNYTLKETEYCEFIYSVRLLDQTAFCAQGNENSGNPGDPFVIKVRGPNRTTPIYVIGVDAIHIGRLNPGIFMNLYPYVEWINDVINGKITDPGKTPDNKISGDFDSTKLSTPAEGCGLQPIPENPNELATHSGHWPWMGVILTYSAVHKGVQIKCTATLITSKHLLTSANCVNDRVRSVRLGGPQSFTDHKVVRMEVHPGAKWTEYEDYLAILFLEHEVEFSDQIRTVCLPLEAPVLNDNILYRLYSNNTKLTQPTGYNTKKYSVVGNEKCSSYKIPFTNSVFCAQSNEELGSNGDPFMHAINEEGKYPIYQVALDGYHMNDNPTVFVNVHPYIGWIKDTITENIEMTKNEVIFPVLRAKEK